MTVDERGLGRLRRVDPRQYFAREEHDFTPWMRRHVDVLSDALGVDILADEVEVRVGDFELDLLGRDADGRVVVVENQLESTNHDHLGKLLVYGAGLEAGLVVWVTPAFRSEHRRALDWLNERTDEDVQFFGIELDLVQIADSPPAPVFRVVARPNDWQKAVKTRSGTSQDAAAKLAAAPDELRELFARLREAVLAFGPDATERQQKMYIAFKRRGNFLTVVPQRSQLKLYLHLPDDYQPPEAIVSDVRGKGHWGTGDWEALLSTENQLDSVIRLARVAYEGQRPHIAGLSPPLRPLSLEEEQVP